MILGAHMRASGGLDLAILRGKEIGCDAVQLFTKSPSQWRAMPLTDQMVNAFRDAVRSTGIYPVVAHDAYLINLAAPDTTVLNRSREAFLEEVRRAERLGLTHLVTHMGAHLGKGEEFGLNCLITSLRMTLNATEGMNVKIALESTAGQGTTLGYRFEQIAFVLSKLEAHPRLCVCIDMCHIFAAGYDFRSQESYAQTFDSLERTIGIDRIALIHANDSKRALGSRVDQHTHIGQGEIGREGFRNLLRDRRWKDIPILLETPESSTMHKVNLMMLRRLAGRRTYMPRNGACPERSRRLALSEVEGGGV